MCGGNGHLSLLWLFCFPFVQRLFLSVSFVALGLQPSANSVHVWGSKEWQVCLCLTHGFVWIHTKIEQSTRVMRRCGAVYLCFRSKRLWNDQKILFCFSASLLLLSAAALPRLIQSLPHSTAAPWGRGEGPGHSLTLLIQGKWKILCVYPVIWIDSKI